MWPANSRIYEVHTWPWLGRLSKQYGSAITLGNVPAEALAAELEGFDTLWLMGVWERSPAAVEIALHHPALLAEFRRALPEFTQADVPGSPYAVKRYAVDKNLGGNEGLAALRRQLAGRGVKLILDYVPNHTAIDHLWTLDCPGMYLGGSADDRQDDPGGYFEAGGAVLAHGKDPYFSAWTDTAQINAFSALAREKAQATLLELAGMCDGVRCDMAMLLEDSVFSRTWGGKAGARPGRPFWKEVISGVKDRRPEFKFLAEVYWDMESALLAQGFDYCYDKRLYDRLVSLDTAGLKLHLGAAPDFQQKLLRFLENHDEPRAAAALVPGPLRSAAVIALCLPGASLVYEGQREGAKVKLPVQLGRRPEEPRGEALSAFYARLLAIAGRLKRPGAVWRLADLAAAYLEGLKALSRRGGQLSGVSSVASFFVSRIDAAVDAELDKAGGAALKGKTAIANAKNSYLAFKERFAGPEWDALAARGARPQRLLWASTGVKNPAYPDTLYVDGLIGGPTVNTVPPATLKAFLDHGTAAPTLEKDSAWALEHLAQLARLGIDLGTITDRLQTEGVDAFGKSFENIMTAIRAKAGK